MNDFNAGNFSNFEIFNDENLGSVRTLTDENGQIWFLGNDVAECLGYGQKHLAEEVTKFTDKSDRRVLNYCDSRDSGESKFWQNSADRKDKVFINEAGVYAMIFLSRKPKAIEFKDWILHTVIPSIREHGGYILGQEQIKDKTDRENLLAQISGLADQVETLNLANRILELRNSELEKEIAGTKEELEELQGLYVEAEATNTATKKSWDETKARLAKEQSKNSTLKSKYDKACARAKKLSKFGQAVQNRLGAEIEFAQTMKDILDVETAKSSAYLHEIVRIKNPSITDYENALAESEKISEMARKQKESSRGETYFVDSDGSVSFTKTDRNER